MGDRPSQPPPAPVRTPDLRELPDAAAILPTHGFGSLCSAGFPVGGADTADAMHQRRENPALLMDEDAFVARLVAGLDDYPRYYA